MKPKESDWKKYSKLIPLWRDRYLEDINDQLVRLLSENEKSPTERFWEARERIEEEARVLKRCLDYHSRSKMLMPMLLMRRYGLIKEEDLLQFSEDLQRDLSPLPEFTKESA